MHQDSLEPAAIRFTLTGVCQAIRIFCPAFSCIYIHRNLSARGVKCSVKDDTLMGCVQKWRVYSLEVQCILAYLSTNYIMPFNKW